LRRYCRFGRHLKVRSAWPSEPSHFASGDGIPLNLPGADELCGPLLAAKADAPPTAMKTAIVAITLA